jgi:hypothetical protein
MRSISLKRIVRRTVPVAIALLLLASCAKAPGEKAGNGAPTTSPAAGAPATRPAPETILLHARDAAVHGRTLRYEPDPHKDTLGYWTDAADWASWQFGVNHPGTYAVEILQGCGKGSGGSEVEFRSAGRVLRVTVEDTGGFQNFVPREIGEFDFDRAGTYTLEVRPVTKPGLAVMDLRQVTLREVSSRHQPAPAGAAR